MPTNLLPPSFDGDLSEAIAHFWRARDIAAGSQSGSRGNVIAGKNLDGFLSLVTAVAKHCGLPETVVFTQGRKHVTLPGHFRPTKNWDALIIHEKRLLAVLEFKSQVGSFGNNFNNRSEEVIGSAADLWVASRYGAFLPSNHVTAGFEPDSDPRPPFLGYLMLLEDCERSTLPVECFSPHFRVDGDFITASYATRYRILCERLMNERLYKSAALVLSPSGAMGLSGHHRSLSEATSARSLFVQLAAQLLADTQT